MLPSLVLGTEMDHSFAHEFFRSLREAGFAVLSDTFLFQDRLGGFRMRSMNLFFDPELSLGNHSLVFGLHGCLASTDSCSSPGVLGSGLSLGRCLEIYR